MKIFSLVLNSVEFDSRVRKTARTLSAYGDVTVFGFRDDPDQPWLILNDDYRIVRKIVYSKDLHVGISKRLAQGRAYFRYLISVGFAARKADVVVCNDLTALPIGIFAKFFRRRLKLVYDSHEYQAHTRWVSPRKRMIIRLIERFALRFTAANVVVSPSIAEAYVQDYGITRPHVVMNCPQSSNPAPSDRLRAKIGAGPNDCVFLFQGGLTEGRGIEQMLAAFKLAAHPNHRLVFMGYGPLEGKIRREADMDRRIALVSAVPPSEVLEHTVDADFGLCFLTDDCLNHRYALPNKVFEYLMAGVPVIVNDLFEVRKLIESYNAGLIVTDVTESSFTQAIRRVEHYSRTDFLAKLSELKATYSWEKQAEVWDGVMRTIGVECSK